MITYTRKIVFPEHPRVAVVSDPQTDDMRTMIDDIQRVEPFSTIPKRIVQEYAAALQAELDRSFIQLAIRGF